MKNNLKETTIGKALKLKSGVQLSAKNMVLDGIYPVYGGNGINGFHNKYLFESPKIVIGRVGAHCGNVHKTEPFSWITDNALYVVEKFEEYIDEYLIHLLRHLNLNQYSSQSGQPLISAGRLKNVKIPLPPLPIQKRIADLLDKADTLRQKDRALLEQYDRLAESVFLEMFGQETEDYSKWEEVKISKLAKPVKGSMRTGPFGSNLKHEEFLEDGEVAVLGIDNAVENFFKWGKKRFISREKYNELRRYTIFPRDVIITIMGTLGRTAVIPNDIPLAINTKHLAALTLNPKYANPYFIAFCIRSHPYVLAQINANTRGAIMAGLNLTIVKELKIKLPPVALQDHFEKLLGNIKSQKEIVKVQMEKSESLFQSLLQKAFRGELFQKHVEQETLSQE